MKSAHTPRAPRPRIPLHLRLAVLGVLLAQGALAFAQGTASDEARAISRSFRAFELTAFHDPASATKD